MKWKPADHVTEEEVFGRKKKKKAEIIFDSSFREPPKPPKFRKEEKCSRCGKIVLEEGVGFVCINCVG
jgi:hypothetical protein